MRWKVLLFLLLIPIGSGLAHGGYTIEQYLNIKYAKDGQFSSDETQVFYLSDESGSYQIWRIPIQGGASAQLTDLAEPIGYFQVSPTDNRVIYMIDSGGDENYQVYLMSGDGKETRLLAGKPGYRINSPHFSPDGSRIAFTANFRDKRYFDVYVYDLTGDTMRMVREVNGVNEIEAWSPAGKELIVSTWDNNYNNNLRLVDATTGEHQLLTPHTGDATFGPVAWPDDKFGKTGFYLVSDKMQTFRKLATFKLKRLVMDYQDSAPWDTENLCISKDGRVLGYTLNAKGFSQMFMIDLKKQKYWATPFLPKGVVKSMKLSKNGDKALYTFSGAAYNTDLWIYDKASDKIRRLTGSSTAGIDPKTFVEPFLAEYVGATGLEIPSLFYVPQGAKKDGSLPCLLYVHGGPESQERPDFYAVFQYFIHRGFAILAPNFRGSTGYGKPYMMADNGPARRNAVLDAAAGIKWLGRNGYVDKERIGVFGGSYGGYMVLALMTEHPSLFRAGVDVVGISNFVTFLERTHPSRRPLREAEYGSLDKDRLLLEDLSPIHRIDKIQGALMVIHGAQDPRVPVSEAEQVVQKAREKGIEVEYLVYEDEGHGLKKLKNRLDAYPKMVAFFETHLAKKPALKENSGTPAEEKAAGETP